ncbi:hypothetical protein CCP1ISM_6830002 [Azospirillaceae bacterium]
MLDLTTGAMLTVDLADRPLYALLTEYDPVRVHERVVEQGAPLGSAVTLWRGRLGVVQDRVSELGLTVYDGQLAYDTPIQTERYGGSGGYDGPAELRGTTKERCIGQVPILRPQYLGGRRRLARLGLQRRSPHPRRPAGLVVGGGAGAHRRRPHGVDL